MLVIRAACAYIVGVETDSPILVDAHCHLQDPSLGPHLAEVLERARAAGVAGMVCNATSPFDWQDVYDLAKANADVYPCYGVHPWFVGHRRGEWLDQLESYLLTSPSAVGEIGLDRYIEPRDEAAQEDAFRGQLALARRLHRPAMLHIVRAWDWFMTVLKDCPPPAEGFLLHAYGGSAELVGPLAEMGARFSFGPTVLDATRTRARQALLAVPRDRLLIETDAPDMAPHDIAPHFTAPDGHPLNEVANLPHVLTGVAALLNVTPAELAELTTNNTNTLLAG